MQKNGGAEKHVIERFKRAMIAMKKSIGVEYRRKNIRK